MRKRVFPLIVVLSLLLNSILPLNVFAVTTGDDANNVFVTAKSEKTITIQKVEDLDEPFDTFNGVLEVTTEEFYDIERDYSQICVVSIKNTENYPVEYYLTVNNTYSDISLDFIKGGSKGEPLLIDPDETQEVELAVFAQNAERESYYLPISAFIVGQEEPDAQSAVMLNCKGVALNFSCEKISTDETTLTNTFQLQNNGEALTDVTVSISGDAKGYTQINPIISNFEMATNATTTFKAIPDLARPCRHKIDKW